MVPGRGGTELARCASPEKTNPLTPRGEPASGPTHLSGHTENKPPESSPAQMGSAPRPPQGNPTDPNPVQSLVTPPMPEKHERTLACLAHGLAVFGPLWLPFVAFIAFRPFSRFAARHALRASLDNIGVELSLFLLTAVGVIWWIVQLVTTIANNQPFDFWQAVTRFVLVVSVWCILQTYNLVQAIVWIRRAWKGEDPQMHAWLERIAPRALPQ